MCGIAGLLGPPGAPIERAAMASRMTATLVHRGPDDSGSWADPSGEAAFGFQRLVDPRPVAGRSSADVLCRGSVHGRLQRRDLQLRRAQGRAGGRRLLVPRQVGHRGAPRGDQPVGHRGRDPAAVGHVRARRLGRARASAPPRSRPPGQEAALLWLARQHLPVRIGAQGPASAPRLSGADRPGCARQLRAVLVCPVAAVDLSGHPEATARPAG